MSDSFFIDRGYGFRGVYPINDVTPFTMRDSFTYLERLRLLFQLLEKMGVDIGAEFEVIRELIETINNRQGSYEVIHLDLSDGNKVLNLPADIPSNHVFYALITQGPTGGNIIALGDGITGSPVVNSEPGSLTLFKFVPNGDQTFYLDDTDRQLFDSIDVLRQDMLDIVQAMNEAMSQLQDDVSDQLSTTVDQVNNSMSDLESELDGRMTVVETKIDDHVARSYINARNYGVVGNGVANDTAAFQAAVNACPEGGVITAPGCRMAITDTIIVNRNNITFEKIHLIGATGLVNKPAVRVNGAHFSARDCRIEGRNNIGDGFVITGGGKVSITGCNIDNLNATDSSCRAIFVNYSYSTNGGAYIADNTIANLYASGNSTVGDDSGAVRAIVVADNKASTIGQFIVNNRCFNILGEEGDAIHVICTGNSGENFPRMDTVVSGNLVNRFSRRGIKVQAGHVIVENNSIYSDAGDRLNPTYTSLDAIYSSNLQIRNNFFSGNDITHLSINGNPNANVSYTSITGNSILANESTQQSTYAVYFTNVRRVIIADNVIQGTTNGIRAGGGNVSDVIIRGNYQVVGTAGFINPAIFLGTNVVRSVIDNNTMIGNAQSYYIYAHGPGTVIRNNYANGNADTAFIYSASNVNAPFITGNNANVGTFVSTPDGTQNNILNGMNVGQGRSNNIIFSGSIPTSSHSSRSFERGDIVINTGTGSNTGWRCTASGTPGTWTSF